MIFDSGFLGYFTHAGMIVKCVMMLLVSASVLSWTYILQRLFYIKDVKAVSRHFEAAFWEGGDIAKLYEGVERKTNTQGLEVIFQAGFKEFARMHKQVGATAGGIVENVKRAMWGANTREQDKLEAQLPVLATVGAISPFIGIFGTVWGIMTSFRALADVQQATISMVAPGIAEALVATAMGLFAAIPAVIAYNLFTTDISRLLNRFSAFQDEFANILFRQAQLSANKTHAMES